MKWLGANQKANDNTDEIESISSNGMTQSELDRTFINDGEEDDDSDEGSNEMDVTSCDE